MECNKEEALRARDIAEKKMQNKDFAGARKIVQKAQNIFPELENLAQMLTVCDVHCSAEVKVGGEMDWYGILQLETTVDDSSIKKQFRKLALLLHPDKNKFAGAEAAFKLIGEANVVLSDKAKRNLYDMKRRVSPRFDPSRQPAPQMKKDYCTRNNFGTVNFSGVNNQQQQPSAFAINQTFWTICTVCGMRYQYYKSILNKSLRCQNCLKTFIAYDLSANIAPTGVNPSQPWNTFNPQVPQQTNKTTQPSQSGNASSIRGFKGSVDGAPYSHFEHGGQRPNVKRNKVNDNGGARRDAKPPMPKVPKPPMAKADQKRTRKVVVDASDSDATSSDSEDEIIQVNDPQSQHFSPSGAPTRRSTRHKHNINYSEVGSDEDADDFPTSGYKKLRGEPSGSSDEVIPGLNANDSTEEKVKDNNKDESFREQANGSNLVNIDTGRKAGSERVLPNASSTMATPDHGSFSYPDPEFFDFDKLRHIGQFVVDQIWALYDNVDGMPRFYARIRQVCSTHFKIQFTWLECNPLNDVVTTWCNEQLPIACGNYILGSTEFSEDQLMFSHAVSWEKGRKRNSYNVYPRKGEVWALFKNWNIRWSSGADKQRLYEYEVVEVLSDFAAGTGIGVMPLVKIDGFVSLFMQSEEKVTASYVIPPDEILRFSHNVPSYRLTGTEREGIPQGCLELDPASLPTSFLELFPSVNPCSGRSRTENLNEPSSSGIKPTTYEKPGSSEVLGTKNIDDMEQYQAGERQLKDLMDAQNYTKEPKIDTVEKDDLGTGHVNASENENLATISSSNSIILEYPDAEFHNFDDARTFANVQCGQIWALYSDVDKYPKYYGLVKKVELDHKVHVAWLEAFLMTAEQERWRSEGLPISCGTFKVEHHQIVEFDNTGIFSHLVRTKPNAKKDMYDILPCHGEIWAVYKNWHAGWRRSDWENCEYDVVEICECTDVAIKVRTLMKVKGYRAVFKYDVEARAGTMDISACQYVRFSHRIPSFKLTNERGGKLKGCWELDTASAPNILC